MVDGSRDAVRRCSIPAANPGEQLAMERLVFSDLNVFFRRPFRQAFVSRQSAGRRTNPNASSVAKASIVFLATVCSPLAMAHDILADGDHANDWIKELKNGNGEGCCGDNDCRPLERGNLTTTSSGRLGVLLHGQVFLVPESSILRENSPDGRAWACPKMIPSLGGFSYSVVGIRCLLLPPTI
jgi:hypothetical protein